MLRNKADVDGAVAEVIDSGVVEVGCDVASSRH